MPIAVFYHAYLPSARAEEVFMEQVIALRYSGLADQATELHVGLNGSPLGSLIIAAMLPQAKIACNPANDRGEAFTLQLLQAWLPEHRGWLVCYHHLKGASHPAGSFNDRWRHCVERTVIWNWKNCAQDLQSGRDTVGAHWYVNADQRYWAGNFWWATSEYLATLPPVNPKTVSGRSYESEVWIGQGPNRPKIRPYAHHALMSGCH